MSTYRRIVSLLGDGDWHEARELPTVFPAEWISELRKEGHDVLERDEGDVVVRLRNWPVLTKPRGLRRQGD